jgi:DNA-binding NarL/FixJ family response regulator
MKIYIVDNTEQTKSQCTTISAEFRFFADEIQAVNAVEQQAPDLILLHYNLRGKDTARYIDLLLTICPQTNIVLIGDNLSDEQVVNCLLLGAKGYQNISELAFYIDKIIHVILAGEAWVSRRLTSCLLDAVRKQTGLDDPNFYFAGQYIFSAAHQKM